MENLNKKKIIIENKSNCVLSRIKKEDFSRKKSIYEAKKTPDISYFFPSTSFKYLAC